ncbi:hypothetical protein ZOSMA_90G00280 [Zostera marina]|uniref:Reticulon-like protein n=1 Tax=Zostera marina TaxID=29655 RepID=A0A0K9NLA0_ZOSMR|nr:hypothetical protein ZOSMA_90G00280 [Zostera marina]
MDGEKKRPARSTSVVAGSVWESRMKMDQIKGGIKVFVANATDEAAVVGSLERRKRKSWKPVDNDRSNSNDLRKTLSALLPAQVDGDSDDADEDDGFEVEVEDKKVDQIWLEESIAPSSVSKEENLHPESPPTEDDFYDTISDSSNSFQSIVDLVMWKDIPRSSFMFGIGTFLLISSSYTSDLDFSLISAGSYLGLIYLAIIFVYKSFINRAEYEDLSDSSQFEIKEEEASRFVKKVLPFVNELVVNIRALFSGDPAIVMKLGVFLFVLARCGGMITIWSLFKLAFFTIFSIPKLLSSYSSQLSLYGKVWTERCSDIWSSCAYKKVFGVIAFTLIWNLCSTVTRIWAVFMLVVIVRYSQHSMVGSSEWDDEKNKSQQHKLEKDDDKRRQKNGHENQQRREGRRITNVEHRQRPLWSTKSSPSVISAKTNKKAF